MPQQNWKVLQKKFLEKAEKGDNHHREREGKNRIFSLKISTHTRKLHTNMGVFW